MGDHFKKAALFRRRLIPALLLLVLVLSSFPGAVLAHEDCKRVLVLNSYHQGYPWCDAVMEAVRAEFDASDVHTELYFEYMDTKRYAPSLVSPQLKSLFKLKYPIAFFSLIIVSDQPALDFVLEYRETLFPDVPIVFFGASPDLNSSYPAVTGVAEIPSYGDTIDLALRLHPKTEEIIVTGNRDRHSAQRYHEMFAHDAAPFQGRVKFSYWYDLPENELLEKFRGLPEHRLVMPLSLVREQEGTEAEHLVPTLELTKKIKAIRDVPIYIHFDFNLGNGAIGGKLVNSHKQGEIAAQLGLRILLGENPDSMDVVSLENEYIFDYRELQRFKVSLDQLPPGSTVLNKPPSFYPIEKRYVWLGIGLFIGLVAFTIVLLKTIVTRKRIEKRLRKSEQRFRSVFETTAVGMLILSTDWRIVKANSAFCRILGHSKHSLQNRKIGDIVFSEDQERIRPQLEEIEAGVRRFFHCEKRYHHKSGETVWGRNSVASVVGEDGTPLYYVSQLQDITDQKRSEMDLQASENKYRSLSREFEALLDGIPDSLVLLSPEMKMVWGNKGSARLFGTDPDSLSGRHCYAMRRCNKGPGESCPSVRCFQSGEPEEGQMTSRDDRNWEIKAFPLKDKDGQVVNVIEMASDVTEKIQLREEALRSAQLASLGELAAGVAHEINNPINGIINYAQLLVDSSEGEGQGQDKEILEGVIEEGGRIANIVGGLLSFARETKDEKETLPFKAIYSATLTMIESQFRKDGIRLEVDFPVDLPDVLAHKQQVQQVILNLLSNARYALNQKFHGGHEDKRIEIRGRVVPGHDHSMVRVTFKDYGTGIPKYLHEKVMDPFFSTKPSDKGTGLGLSISHGIIRDHGGKISIDSVEGEFTQIAVELPVSGEMGVCA